MFKYTELPTDVFEKLSVNAGILLKDFNVANGSYNKADIIGATSGGVNVTHTPTTSDWGDDIDNCPKNTKELMHIDSVEEKMSGTFVSADTPLAKMLMGAYTEVANGGIKPALTVGDDTFHTLWYVCDYGEETSKGFIAIKMENAYSTGGFAIQSTDKAKGQFAFEFTGMGTVTDVSFTPLTFYIGTATETPQQEEE